VKIYFHGLKVESVSYNNIQEETKKEDFTFLRKLTEFDPLPDNSHPYLEIKNISSITIQNNSEAFQISIP
jgi:alpha-glucosidase